MALALSKENYTLHKIHSLTGIIPVGYYLVQHLTLNTFSLAGPSKFNAILAFFEAMPIHFQIALKAVAIWIPLIFHAVYGVFIVARAKYNYAEPKYHFKENRYFTYQRWSGILAFLFLAYHMTSTSIAGKVYGEEIIQYQAWAAKLASGGTYLILIVYLLGILACSYHFSFGIWSFCIRWGIAVSEKAQKSIWQVSKFMFVFVTLMGYLALVGFFYPVLGNNHAAETEKPVEPTPISNPL